MNKLAITLIATALVTTIGATALTSSVSAQEGPQSPPRMTGIMEEFGGAGRLCAPDRAEKLDAMLSRLAKRIDLNTEQTEAFEVFRADALVAQTGVADICAEVKPDEDADLIDRLNAGQTVMAAQLDSMASVLPSLETFYDSLTDEQKAKMRPVRGSLRQGPHQGPNAQGPNGQNKGQTGADGQSGDGDSNA